MSTETLEQLLDRIAQHVADRDHYGSFQKPASGTPTNVTDKTSLLQHMRDMINDPATKSFVASEDGKKVYFYNSRTNTVVILDPNSPAGGSAYRPKNPSQGERWFEKQKELWLAGAPGRTIEPHVGGLEGAERRLGGTPHAPSSPHAPSAHPTPHGEGRVGRVIAAVGIAVTAITASNAANAETSTGSAVVAAGREIASALIPFSGAATAAANGRAAECIVSFIGDCAWIGLGVSEALRPMMRAMGADVEPGMIESALARRSPTQDPRKNEMMGMIRDIPALSPEELKKRGVPSLPNGFVYDIASKKYEVQQEMDKIKQLMNGRQLEDLSADEVKKYSRSISRIQNTCAEMNNIWSREVERKLGPSVNYGNNDPVKIMRDQIAENLTRGERRSKDLMGFSTTAFSDEKRMSGIDLTTTFYSGAVNNITIDKPLEANAVEMTTPATNAADAYAPPQDIKPASDEQPPIVKTPAKSLIGPPVN